MITVDELKEAFGVSEDQDLGHIFGRTKSAVSVWRKKGVPSSIELEARRMAGEPATKKAELLPEEQEALSLIAKLDEKRKRLVIADLYRRLAEQMEAEVDHDQQTRSR